MPRPGTNRTNRRIQVQLTHLGRLPTLVELYCGNGNHTCALASRFARAVAVEIEPTLVAAARENFKVNGVDNADAPRGGLLARRDGQGGERVVDERGDGGRDPRRSPESRMRRGYPSTRREVPERVVHRVRRRLAGEGSQRTGVGGDARRATRGAVRSLSVQQVLRGGGVARGEGDARRVPFHFFGRVSRVACPCSVVTLQVQIP